MSFEYNIYVGILALNTIISTIVAWAIGQRRSTSTARIPFLLMMLASSFYSLVAALEAGSVDLKDKIFWSTLEHVGSGSTMILFVIFAVHFTHNQRWLTFRNITLFLLIPGANIILVATNAWHHLVWTNFIPHPDANNVIIYEHGSGFYWVVGWIYLYAFIGYWLLLKAIFQSSKLHRGQSVLILLGTITPFLGGMSYILRLTPPGLNISPISFVLAGIIYFVSFYQGRLFDLIPIARDVLIENMKDGVLVIDKIHRIVDINKAAQIFLKTDSRCIGKSIEKVFLNWDQIWQGYSEDSRKEILLNREYRFLDLQIISLRQPRKRYLTGYLLSLRDITQSYQAKTKLHEANEQLKAQISKIEALQTKLEEQAIRDGLTNLYNRRYFEEILPQELARVMRENIPMAILLLDIDHFKNVNDTFGHQVGDKVLQAFAELLKCYSRKSDFPCRYGGEEFVLVLPGVTLELAYERAEQIRLAFEALNFQVNQKTVPTTISGGLAMFLANRISRDTLLQNADMALYQAKARGRNQIQVSGNLIEKIKKQSLPQHHQRD